MGKARIKAKDEAGGSQAGGNGAKLRGGWFGSIKGIVGLRPALMGLGVIERPLNDSTDGTHRA